MMIDKNTVGIIKKPHIFYSTWIKAWLCQSEDGPWDVCIGAGESVLDAYRNWKSKCPRMVIDKPKHYYASCSVGGKWRLEE